MLLQILQNVSESNIFFFFWERNQTLIGKKKEYTKTIEMHINGNDDKII